MKYTIFFLSLIFFILTADLGFAQTSSPSLSKTPTPTQSTIQKQINSLTDKIASKVAELDLVEKKGVIGKVTDVSNTKITLNDLNDRTQFIDVDEFTKFSGQDESFGISDIKKGDTLGILGLYNKESRRILARFVNIASFPQVVYGVISKVDTKNFQLKLSMENDKSTTIDHQSSTKSFIFDKEEKVLTKSGFSKFEEGQSIVVIGFPDKKDPLLLSASRIIILPDVARNPKININISTKSPTPTSKETSE